MKSIAWTSFSRCFCEWHNSQRQHLVFKSIYIQDKNNSCLTSTFHIVGGVEFGRWHFVGAGKQYGMVFWKHRLLSNMLSPFQWASGIQRCADTSSIRHIHFQIFRLSLIAKARLCLVTCSPVDRSEWCISSGSSNCIGCCTLVASRQIASEHRMWCWMFWDRISSVFLRIGTHPLFQSWP